MLVMMLGLCSIFVTPQPSFAGVPVAYAQNGEEGEGEGEGEEGGGEEGKDFDAKVETIELVDPPQTAANSEDLVKDVANLAQKSHRLFAPLINFFSFQIGNFLGNDYIYGGAMGKMLQKIWVISRNLVNIAFVFILLWMALKEIFSINQESELKKNLIKFVLLLVAVNFSWLGTRVVLDAANVVTHAVFAIPSGISEPPSSTEGAESVQCKVNDPEEPISGSCYPTAIFAPTDSGTSNPLAWEDSECDKVKESYEDAYDEDGSANLGGKEENQKFWWRTSICYENLNLVKYDQNTAVIYLTYGMARIQNLVNATAGTDIVQLSVGILLSLVIQLAYTIALLALFMALIIRMAMLWFFVAFSPFIVMVIWFGEGFYQDKEFGEFKFGIPEFVNWAFVPAKVGAIFAVSFIMISAGQATGAVKATLFDNASSKSGFVFRILEPESLFMGIGSLQSFIWLIMSLAILWIGVFAVLSKMSIVGKVTDRINEYGKGVAKLVATAPYWAPVLPLGKGGAKASVRSMAQGLDVRGTLEKYKGVEGEAADVRKLNATARNVDFTQVMSRLDHPAGFNQSRANWIAGKYGFKDLEQMMQQDRKTLVAAFKKSRNPGTHAGREEELYDKLVTVQRQESSAEKSRRLQDTAAATEKGTEEALRKTGGKPAPPGTALPSTPGPGQAPGGPAATPTPPTTGGPTGGGGA